MTLIWRIRVASAKSVLQRLKPRWLWCVCVVAKATTYKDARIATETLSESGARLGADAEETRA